MKELNPKIYKTEGFSLIGISTEMSFAENKTGELWQKFIPLKMSILGKKQVDLFSVEVYKDLSFFSNFNPTLSFTKWAAIKNEDLEKIPSALEILEIPVGKYAIFNYKGSSSKAPQFYQRIFQQWLPTSKFRLDNRPHLAIMGEKYKNNDPTSEEEIWIPIQ
ncbi:GyrI-like domain-containing protein [Zunongwangia sp. HRR-M8]|uniref:GyrI-like domain-containing protein n=1 Tax=Zunongwangia sp. HRR-M8 TaxID=3015170 RepID=UPI0022DD170C|nr:effector binding domain-containing protein [Zunongwangia sp. HRR-M8]WBL22562.1 effector binding domain-containing protein [Zunongwangia sp. HRR-M8]